MRNNIFAALIVIVTLSGCGAANISFNVMEPAPVSIPQSIQTIAIVDRSFPENTDAKKIESLLTLEGPQQDRAARQSAMAGLRNSLSNSDRFKIVLTDEMMVGSGTGTIFPDPLPWSTLEEIAAKYNADAIVALETFDSDFIVTSGTRTGQNLIEFYGKGVATVKCGFRMYVPANKAIVDEFRFSESRTWDAGGLSVLAAVNTLLTKTDAINSTSETAGYTYGERITPSWYRITRDFFREGGGNDDLAQGGRMMDLNEWDMAIESLEKAVENGNKKAKGRAAHNLAVVYEIIGDLNKAKEWATVAWGKYEEKKSQDYGYILGNRIRAEEVLRSQMR